MYASVLTRTLELPLGRIRGIIGSGGNANMQLGDGDHLAERILGYAGHFFKNFLGFAGQFSPNTLGLGLRLGLVFVLPAGPRRGDLAR